MDNPTASVKNHRPGKWYRRVASRVNLAGLFKARKMSVRRFRVALATPELLLSAVADATSEECLAFLPAFKRRAKFSSTLRVERAH